MLCSLFLDSIEKELVQLQKQSRFRNAFILIVRLIDDYLFITDSIDFAHSLIEKWTLDVLPRKHGLFLNTLKSFVTFENSFGVSFQKQLEFLPWCGYLVNVKTLEIQGDYSRYKDNAVLNSFRVEYGSKCGFKLKNRLQFFLAPKVNAVLIDSRINSKPTILLNIFQVFLLAIVKLIAYDRELFLRNKFQTNPKFLFECLDLLIKEFWKLAHRRIASKKDSVQICGLAFNFVEVQTLAAVAFLRVTCRMHWVKNQLKAMVDDKILGKKPQCFVLLQNDLQNAISEEKSLVFTEIIDQIYSIRSCSFQT